MSRFIELHRTYDEAPAVSINVDSIAYFEPGVDDSTRIVFAAGVNGGGQNQGSLASIYVTESYETVKSKFC